jgi:hypothetical protein
MVQLDIYVKRRWLKLYKARRKWVQENPGKFLQTRDPIETQISRFVCMLCDEQKWYYVNQVDKDMPQYHKVGKRWLILCHACWHLKGIYKKHQNAKSIEGLSGCRFCQIQLAIKRNRQRSKALPQQEHPTFTTRPRLVEPSPEDWEPKGVHRSVGLSTRRVRRGNVAGKRSARRGSR